MGQITIAVDAMGGDNAPKAVCEGVLLALRDMPDIAVTLCGPEAALKPLLAGSEDVAGRLTVLDAPEVISMHESPTLAVRKKVNSSMVKAMLEVKEGRCQAFVSAGSTGAVLAGGILRVGRIRGIDRPALAPVLPGRNHPFLLIDSGANVDCAPEFLNQFGLMGSVYMEKVEGVKNPGVGLVNIGTEEEKGNQQAKAAFALMKAQTAYRFTGNVEAREVPTGQDRRPAAEARHARLQEPHELRGARRRAAAGRERGHGEGPRLLQPPGLQKRHSPGAADGGEGRDGHHPRGPGSDDGELEIRNEESGITV